MKWKTSTIILILVASLGLSGFFYYHKIKAVNTLQSQIDQKVEEGMAIEKAKLQGEYDKKEQKLQTEITDLTHKISKLEERNNYLLNGGDIEVYRKDIISKSTKTFSTYKIRKGSVFRHKKSQAILYVKNNQDEIDSIYVDISHENSDSEEYQLYIGQYFYLWSPKHDDLHKILVTFIGDKHVELEWTYYKVKS